MQFKNIFRKAVYVMIALALVFAQCSKSSSPNPPNNGNGNGNGVAVFTLQGNGAACSISSVNGTYTQGSTLTSSNTISVQVNVTTIGTWAISTNTVSGISFSGSGTFTSTGIQSVILAGSGTPVAFGSQSFIVTAGSSSCTFSITVNSINPPPPPPPTNYTNYIHGIVTTSVLFDAQGNISSSETTDDFGLTIKITNANGLIKAKLINADKGTMTVEPVIGVQNKYYVAFSNINNYTSTTMFGNPDTTNKLQLLVYRDGGGEINPGSGVDSFFAVMGTLPAVTGNGKIALRDYSPNQSTVTLSFVQNLFSQPKWTVTTFNKR